MLPSWDRIGTLSHEKQENLRRVSDPILVLLIHASGWLLAGAVVAGSGSDVAPPAYPDHTRLLVVRDARGNERPVRTAADWEIRRGHILAHLQEVMGPLPTNERRVPLDVRVIETRQERGYVRTEDQLCQ